MTQTRGWQDRFRLILSVYLVLIDKDNRVLQLKRQNTGFADGEYGLPAGHVDGNEEARLAMCREAKEEVGLTLHPEQLKFVHTMHRHCGDHERLDLFFECREWEGEPVNAEPHKCSELRWSPLNDLPSETINYYKQMFEYVERGETYGHFGF
jgi:ADP-ribose pyrophosphatase YjhB (NUDIX family)